jgi:hypothetical protein
VSWRQSYSVYVPSSGRAVDVRAGLDQSNCMTTDQTLIEAIMRIDVALVRMIEEQRAEQKASLERGRKLPRPQLPELDRGLRSR